MKAITRSNVHIPPPPGTPGTLPINYCESPPCQYKGQCWTNGAKCFQMPTKRAGSIDPDNMGGFTIWPDGTVEVHADTPIIVDDKES